MTPAAKTQLVQTLAREVGFDLAGAAAASPIRRAAYYRQWLAAGYGGTMTYLKHNVQFRSEPGHVLPGARSLICVALNYKRADGYLRPSARPAMPTSSNAEPTGVIAQYARGQDYHVVLRRMLRTLVARLRDSLSEPFEARIFVDTGPLLEKELAVAAGLGWFGKNTCVLNARLGSYLLLGEIASTLELEAASPQTDGCARCTRCLDSCPTGAFIGPRRLDAARCISYVTIESREPIDTRVQAAVGDRVFGCDVCQQVCPYNARAPLATHPAVAASLLPERVKLLPLLELSSPEHRRMLHRTAGLRATPGMWRRNAAVALANAPG